MMRASKAILFALLISLFLPLPALCLEVQDDCNSELVEKLPQDTPLHPKFFFDQHTPQINDNRWLEIVQEIKAGFIKSTLPHDENFDKYLSELNAMEEEFNQVMISKFSLDLINNAKNITLTRFKIIRDPDDDKVSIFSKPNQITIDQNMKAEIRKEYCWRTIAINKMLTKFGEPGRGIAALALRNSVSQWDAYNTEGYLQYPWELYLNGKLAFDDDQLAPPRYQWIILHPGVGVEQAGQSFEKSRMDEVVTIEPLGFIRYTEKRNSYFGASALLTLSSTRDPGKGVLLHWGKFAKVGFVWRDRDESGHAQNGVILSLDLYQMLSGPWQRQLDLRNMVKDKYDSYTQSVNK